MNVFEKLRGQFDANWTTVLVGWNGVGVLSPWPEKWTEFPPLLSPAGVTAYAEERIAISSDPREWNFIAELLSLDLRTETRETVRDILKRLSELNGGDPERELRKWRLVILERLLEEIPQDPVYGLLALTEFWQEFGYPSDSPHTVQGRGNTISPLDYYQEENFSRELKAHRAWIERENAAIKKLTASDDREQWPSGAGVERGTFRPDLNEHLPLTTRIPGEA